MTLREQIRRLCVEHLGSYLEEQPHLYSFPSQLRDLCVRLFVMADPPLLAVKAARTAFIMLHDTGVVGKDVPAVEE